MLAIEAGGIAALIVGAVAVARSSAFSGLRKITSHLPGVPDSAPPEPSEEAAAEPAGPGEPPGPAQRTGRKVHGPANGGGVTPGRLLYTEYTECDAKMLSAIASAIMARLVTISPAAWLSSGIRRRNGGDGMYWSQNKIPTAK